MPNFSDALHHLYTITYPPSGYSVVSGKLNKSLFLKGSDDDDYLHHPLTLISSFIGLPNRKLGKRMPQSWLNLFYNFIGWQPNASLGKKIVNGISMPVVMICHLVVILPSFAKNIVKLATELLPVMIKFGLSLASAQLQQTAEQVRQPIKTLSLVGLYTVNSLYYATSLVYFIGRATTSPLNGARCAFRDGYQFGASLAKEGSNTSKILGYLFGFALSSLSSAATTVIYGLTAPLAIKFIAANVAPSIISHLPAAIVSKLSPIVKGLLTADHKVATFFKPICYTLGLSLTEALVRNVGIRVGQVIALGVNTARRYIHHWWRAPTQELTTESERQSLLRSSSSRIQTVIGVKQNNTKTSSQISHSFSDLKVNAAFTRSKPLRLFQSLDAPRITQTNAATTSKTIKSIKR